MLELSLQPLGWRKWGDQSIYVYSRVPLALGECGWSVGAHCRECGRALSCWEYVHVVGQVKKYSRWPSLDQVMLPNRVDDREVVCHPCFEALYALTRE